MILDAKLFAAAAVSTPAAGTLYTSATNVRTRITKLTFYNGSGGALNLTVYKVDSGGAAGATNIIAYKTLADKETYECYAIQQHELDAGDFISAMASGAGIVAHGAGLKIT